MVNKNDVITFFDELSVCWDADMIMDEQRIERILDYAGVKTGSTVLDVACGTGVLIPFYLKHKVKKVTGVDISAKMIAIAKDKFHGCKDVDFCTGDMEELSLDQQFDTVVVYNAFPHFTDPKKLIKQLAVHLKEGGTLSIAHGMSREQIDRHHLGKASKVSKGLMSADELAEIFEKSLEVSVKISDNRMYQVVGNKLGR